MILKDQSAQFNVLKEDEVFGQYFEKAVGSLPVKLSYPVKLLTKTLLFND